MSNDNNNSLSLRDLYYVLFKHKAAVTLLILSTLITVIIGIYVWPESYQANARIIVKLGRENVSIQSASPWSQQQVITTRLSKEDINSEIAMLDNRQIIEVIVSKLGTDYLFPKAVKPNTFFKGLKYDLKQFVSKCSDVINDFLYRIDLKKELLPNEKAIMAIQKKLSIEHVPDSDVIEVQLRWGNPDIAKEILENLLDSFLTHHLEAHSISGGYDFFNQQVEILEKELSEYENNLNTLKEQKGIVLYDDQAKMLLERRNASSLSLKQTDIELSETKAKIAVLQGQLSQEPEIIEVTREVKRNPVIDLLKTRLLELELESKKIQGKYVASSRPALNIAEEIEKVKNNIIQEEDKVLGTATTGNNPVYNDIRKELLLQQVNLESLTKKNITLNQQHKSISRELENLAELGIKIKRLDREIAIFEQNYKLYRNRREDARISNFQDAAKIVNVKVIAPPSATFVPVSPRKLLLIGLGFVLSLTLGLVFPFLLDYLDHSVNTAEDVRQHLEMPLLATIRETRKVK